MKKTFSIFFLLVTVRAFALLGNIGGGLSVGNFAFDGAPLTPDTFTSSNNIVSGSFDEYGVFHAKSTTPQTYFGDIVYNIDPNSFTVIGGTLYSKGLANGGFYASMVTNYPPDTFATNTTMLLGAVPSYFGYDVYLQTTATGMTLPQGGAYVMASSDGGATWFSHPTNVPCLVELMDSTGRNDYSTNVVIYSYVNPSQVGSTNDYSTSTIFVAPATDNRSPVTLSQAGTIAAAAVPGWANSPAVATVNLAGKSLVLDNVWNVTTKNGQMIWTANVGTFATFTPGITAGARSVINSISLSGTNLTFQVTAATVPTMQYVTNMTSTSWTTLPDQTNWQSGGFWWVMAPTDPTQNRFFRSVTSGTNTTAATLVFNAQLSSTFIFTNALGARFSLQVNSTTNGFVFIPQ